jgi:hypothetical protein
MNKNLVLVNCGKSPISIFTPHGKPITIPPGIGISGDQAWLGKHIGVNDLTLIQQVPADFKIRGITEPMKEELVRDTRQASHFRNPEPKRVVASSRVPTVRTKASEALEAGESSSTSDLSKAVGSDAGSGEATYDGRTASIWRNHIISVSDSTLSQQLKLQDLREVAALLGIDSADVLATKRDLITSLRVKTGGRPQ